MGDSPARSNVGSPDASIASGKKSRQDNQSRQSGRVTFPNSAKSSSNHSVLSDDTMPAGNPFKMPPDSDIFLMRDKERQRKKQERLRQRDLKVHEKTTYASKVNFKTAQMIKPTDSDEEKDDEETDKAVAVKDDPQFTIAVTRDRHVEKESLAEYIAKKREMFLVQYSLGVKRDETQKLEEIAQAEERKLELAEQYLEEDAAMFDEFLKENDSNSAEAMRIAETETKAKLEKVAEIKRINANMMAIKSEISKYEDTLKEYQMYRNFLENLTPPEIKKDIDERRSKKRAERRAEREKVKAAQRTTSDLVQEKVDTKSKKRSGKHPDVAKKGSATKRTAEQESTVSTVTESDDDSDEDLELFFTDPQQLLDIFAELEEQNLSLIQNSQETEEALEEMKQTIKVTKQKMEKETSILKEQIDKLNTQIRKEEKRAEELKIKAKMFSYGEFKQEDQEKMLAQLNKKVEEVYRSCIGDNEANISLTGAKGQKLNIKTDWELILENTLQMLTNIENRLEELFEQIETMPQDKVEAAEKAKEKERRLKLREEKMEQQRLHQEERVRKALERAKAEPKKQTGRKLVFRSEPPRHKKKEDDRNDQQSKEEEELAYFFTW
ncbi:cilia- and flagella-associated protein 100-like isoform X2 [Mercenaria mercenaria]|uniref:cilia- and flagella-associated protein 100-like isoform X2 n=1 Tax=Mercenaria mercenaria TaxID=6596 RepID=UPI001E1D7C39|nr:cilia- and flagella-associated protein 100-like isoform X2 [Mercenaria mercenaria]